MYVPVFSEENKLLKSGDEKVLWYFTDVPACFTLWGSYLITTEIPY